MSQTTENNILSQLTGKQTLPDVPVDDLLKVAQQYPAFGVAQFLLAKKAFTENLAHREKYAQKAAMHFSNAHWFHFKLNEEELMQISAPAQQAAVETAPPAEDVDEIIIQGFEETLAEENTAAEDENLAKSTGEAKVEQPVVEEQPATEEPVIEQVVDTPAGPEEVIIEDTPEDDTADARVEGSSHSNGVDGFLPLEEEQAEQPAEEDTIEEPVNEVPAESRVTEPASGADRQEENVPVEVQTTGETPVAENDEPAEQHTHITLDEHLSEIVAELEQADTEAKEESGDNYNEAFEDADAESEARLESGLAEIKEESEANDTEALKEQVAENEPQPELTPAETDEDSEANYTEVFEEPEAKNEPQPELTPAETEEETEANDTEAFEEPGAENEVIAPVLNKKISSVLQEQLEEFKKPVAENAPVPIETEPYHTVDYFASQGIKLSAELQKQDHLAVKVKKFTDWLKQMKRINPTPVDLGIDAATEHKVQNSAASSNEAKEVVTEAMAEVLAMQGMKEKAIQVYIKLSFLDPAKTAYFAAKIEQLKGM